MKIVKNVSNSKTSEIKNVTSNVNSDKSFMRLKSGVITLLTFVSFQIQFAANSPIAQGIWLRIKVAEDGMFKISYQDLSNAGLNPAGIDPKKIQLWGNQGGMLPENNGGRPNGMRQISILVVGEEDNVMNPTDYIVCWLQGPHSIKYNRNNSVYSHEYNFYEDFAYYYLGVNNYNGLRFQTYQYVGMQPSIALNNTDYYLYKEQDLVNPNKAGRIWLGETMGNETESRSFDISLPPNTIGDLNIAYNIPAAFDEDDGKVKLTLNGTQQILIWDTPLDRTRMQFKNMYGRLVLPNASAVSVSTQILRNNTTSKAWIDYISVWGKKAINTQSSWDILQNTEQTKYNEVRWNTGGFNGKIVCIDNPFNPTLINHNNGVFDYNNSFANSKFVIFKEAELGRPEFIGLAANKNLLATSAVEYLIITHSDFIDAAKELAELRSSKSGLSTKIATVQDIFLEYNAGGQDIVSLRDFIRDERDKALAAGKTLKGVVLLGTASYDLKNRIANNTNFVPVCHGDAEDITYTFCMDDFYGYLDSPGGSPGLYNNNLRLAVPIGRIPVRTLSEAKDFIKKMDAYQSPLSLGEWRNNLYLIADDIDKSYETLFISDCEAAAISTEMINSSANINKIYMDAYPQISTGNQENYPDAKRDLNQVMNTGGLLIGYVGHGGWDALASEKLVTFGDIKNWNNKASFPIMMAATCDFSEIDNPLHVSGGVASLLAPQGGIIGMLGTTRTIYTGGNSRITRAFWSLHGVPKEIDRNLTLGEMYARMKNRGNLDQEDNKFSLLGDPALPLALPQHDIVLDSINGKGIFNFNDTLKAFSVVKIKGHIDNNNGTFFSNFNGELFVTLFDKKTVKFTLNNDKEAGPQPYSDQSSIIYKGKALIKDGKFAFEFPIPKDIAYNVGFGKFSFYAHNGNTDAKGFYKVRIGSSSPVNSLDEQGPIVKLYINDTFFKSGGATSENCTALGYIYDASGINATGTGIGRDLTLILDANTPQEKIYIVNNSFSYDFSTYQRGSILFNLNSLTEGKHTLTLKAWDIFNNSGSKTIEFVVIDKEQLKITHHSANPNPFESKVTIVFEHNLSKTNLKAKLQILDMAGKLIFESFQNLDNAQSRENRIIWDTSNKYFSAGLYMYSLVISDSQGKTAKVSGKIVKKK